MESAHDTAIKLKNNKTHIVLVKKRQIFVKNKK